MKTIWILVWSLIVIFLIALLLVFRTITIQGKPENQYLNPPPLVKGSEIETQSLMIASNVHDIEGANVNLGGTVRYIKVSGTVKGAELKIDALVEGNQISAEYDDVYFMLGNGREELGGHSLSSNISLDAAEIYLKSARKEFATVDLMPIINSGRILRLDFFISSARGNRRIKSAEILYQCEGTCLMELAGEHFLEE